MQHLVDACQAGVQFCVSIDVKDVQLVSCSMSPLSSFLIASERGNLEQSCKEFIGMELHVICVVQNLMIETNEGGFVHGRDPSSGQVCVDGGKVGKEVSTSLDFNLVELLDHLDSPCSSLLVLMYGQVGDDISNRDNIRAVEIIQFIIGF